MNLKDIADAVATIESQKDDDEAAHQLEDELRAAFIRHVAVTAGGELGQMARAVLKTAEISFCRWYA